jgi:hypothetical protein
MRRIRDILRLSFGEGLSPRQVSVSLEIPVSTIFEHQEGAKLAELSWPALGGFDDASLEQARFPLRLPSVIRGPAGVELRQ